MGGVDSTEEAIMEPNGRDDGRDRRPLLDRGPVVQAKVDGAGRAETDVVFDFSGLDTLRFADLAMILTARLGTPPGERVWARALPASVWHLLRALGLDHLFRIYPGPSAKPN
jgi:hypothetical protein